MPLLALVTQPLLPPMPLTMKDEENKGKAARLYKLSEEQGCIIGAHWMGVFYMEGFGVARDVEKAEQMLLKGAKSGNGQSNF